MIFTRIILKRCEFFGFGVSSNARSSIRGFRIIVDELSFKVFLDHLVSPSSSVPTTLSVLKMDSDIGMNCQALNFYFLDFKVCWSDFGCL